MPRLRATCLLIGQSTSGSWIFLAPAQRGPEAFQLTQLDPIFRGHGRMSGASAGSARPKTFALHANCIRFGKDLMSLIGILQLNWIRPGRASVGLRRSACRLCLRKSRYSHRSRHERHQQVFECRSPGDGNGVPNDICSDRGCLSS